MGNLGWRRGSNVLLQVADGHVLELDLLGTIDVVGIGEEADGHAGTGHIGEPNVD